jgi:hypothetical protein
MCSQLIVVSARWNVNVDYVLNSFTERTRSALPNHWPFSFKTSSLALAGPLIHIPDRSPRDEIPSWFLCYLAFGPGIDDNTSMMGRTALSPSVIDSPVTSCSFDVDNHTPSLHYWGLWGRCEVSQGAMERRQRKVDIITSAAFCALRSHPILASGSSSELMIDISYP